MFNGYELGGQVFFAALVRDQPGSGFRWEEQMTQKQVNDFINVQGKGARLTHLSWEEATTFDKFQTINAKARQRGLHLSLLNGVSQ